MSNSNSNCDIPPLKPLISCNNLALLIDDKILFKNLNFELTSCQTIYLTGANGSGKSSLLEIISGLRAINQGEITYHNTQYKEDASINHIALLQHHNALFEEQSVYGNLRFWQKIFGRDNNTLETTISFWNLEELLQVKCGNLSAGWQRKTALARIMLSPAQIWLLDEPTANLDIQSEEKFQEMLNNHIKNHGSAIIASHDHNVDERKYKIVRL